MIEIEEMKPYTLKAGDLVQLKNENVKLYRVLAPADANGTIQLHLIGGSPVDVYNVNVSCIDTKKQENNDELSGMWI